MPDQLVCMMPGCGGMLNNETISLQTGCASSSPCRACSKCGRVHSYKGHLMFNRPGAAVYLRHESLELVMEPISFEVGKTYKTTGCVYVCLEDKDDCALPDMVDLEPNTPLVFDGMDEETFRFHGADGTEYRLHRGDVNAVEAV